MGSARGSVVTGVLLVGALAAAACGRGTGSARAPSAPSGSTAPAVSAEPGDAARPDRAAPPTAGPGDAAPAPALVPPSVPAPPAVPARALLVGDGVMYDAAPALEAALRAGGVAEVLAAPRFGFGLTRPEVYDWRREWRALVSSARPDLVVLLVGPWDVRTVVVDGRLLAPGSPGWEAFYGALADEAVGILTAGGARLLWVGMPLVDVRPDIGARVAPFNAELRRVAARHPSVTFVDAAAALAGPDGRYAAVQLEDGRPERVMKPDGEHLCPAGAARLAAAVVAAVPLSPGDGWRHAAWRADGRYSWGAGGGCPPP